MATAVSAVANGGEVLQPRVVRAVTRDGVRTEVEKKVLRRAISQRTAAQLLPMLEAVVSKGTAKMAQMDGYTVAGKTGTAKKLVNGSYRGHSDYNASFVGFVPSRSPRFTIVVVVDSPHKVSVYGGAVAAPIFKRISEAMLRYEGVPRTINPDPPVVVVRASDTGPVPEPRQASADRAVDVSPARRPVDRSRRLRLERARGAAHDGRGGVDAARARRRLRRGAGSGRGRAAPQRSHRRAVAGPPATRGPGGPRQAMTVGALLQQRPFRAGAAQAISSTRPRLTGDCSGVVYDSRHAAPGCVFVALKGQRADGAAYAVQAMAAGAVGGRRRDPGRVPGERALDRCTGRAAGARAAGGGVLRAPEP